VTGLSGEAAMGRLSTPTEVTAVRAAASRRLRTSIGIPAVSSVLVAIPGLFPA
jgi:hypothetical protein